MSETIHTLIHWGVQHGFRTREEAEAFRDQNPLEIHGRDGVRTEMYEIGTLETPAIVVCKSCEKEIVTAKDPVAFPYCRTCFYTGAAYEDRLQSVIAAIHEAIPGRWVGVWHTGGGCFGLVVQREDEAYKEGAEYYMLTDPSMGVDELAGKGVGIIGRYRDAEEGVYQATVYCDEEDPISLGEAIALIKNDIDDPASFELV